MATIPERIYELDNVSTIVQDVYFVVDKTTLNKAGKMLKSALSYNVAVEGQASLNTYQWLTPAGLLKTTASETRLGLVKLADNAEAIAKEDTEKALVSSNIGPVINALMSQKTTYDISTIISSITGATITVSRWYELFLGGESGGVVKGHCAFILEVTDTPEIVITANIDDANLPPYIQAGTFMHYEAITGKTDAMAAGGCTLSTDTGKLVMKLTRNFAEWDNAQTSIFCVVNYEIFV